MDPRVAGRPWKPHLEYPLIAFQFIHFARAAVHQSGDKFGGATKLFFWRPCRRKRRRNWVEHSVPVLQRNQYLHERRLARARVGVQFVLSMQVIAFAKPREKTAALRSDLPSCEIKEQSENEEGYQGHSYIEQHFS
jgi:hypothetical protein